MLGGEDKLAESLALRIASKWRTDFDENPFIITLTAKQNAALDLMLRSAQITSKEDAIHKQINELIRYAPRNTEEAGEILKMRSMTYTEMMAFIRGDEGEFPRDRSPMRDIDFD